MRRCMVVFALALAMCSIGVGPGETQMTLAGKARWLATHGGIRSSRYGDSTSRLKAMVMQLMTLQFGQATSRAVCFARRESGLNVGAISPTDDYGVGQINRPSHPQFDYWRMIHDPAYSVWAMWIVSSRGRDWSPWNGGTHPC